MCQRLEFIVLAFVALDIVISNRISFVSAGIQSLIVTTDGLPKNRTYYEPEVSDDSEFGTISIPADMSFFILQVHSFNKPVAVSSSKDFKEFVIGNDFGVLQYVPPASSEIYFEFFMKDFGKSADYMVSLVAYRQNDPVPGGCNDVPHQNVFCDDEVVTVEYQQAKSVLNKCDENDVKMEMYYLPFDNIDNKTSYFNALRKMTTVEDIRANGIKVANKFDLSQSYVNYDGIGRIFGCIAYWNNYSAAYVPVVSYGCNTKTGQEKNDIATTFAIFYIFIAVTALLQLEKLTAVLCTTTCVIHIIVAFLPHGFSTLTFTVWVMAIALAGMALYYLDGRDINIVVVSYVLSCWISSVFSGFDLAHITIFYWLLHITACILLWFLFLVDIDDFVHSYTIFLLSGLFALSILNGTYLHHIVLNNKFYFTINFYQPVVTDMIYTRKDGIIFAALLAVLLLYIVCNCIFILLSRRREREVDVRTPLIPASCRNSLNSI